MSESFLIIFRLAKPTCLCLATVAINIRRSNISKKIFQKIKEALKTEKIKLIYGFLNFK